MDRIIWGTSAPHSLGSEQQFIVPLCYLNALPLWITVERLLQIVHVLLPCRALLLLLKPRWSLCRGWEQPLFSGVPPVSCLLEFFEKYDFN